MIFKNSDKKRFSKAGIEETDSFWSIESITPTKKQGVDSRGRNQAQKQSKPEFTVLIEEKTPLTHESSNSVTRSFVQPIPPKQTESMLLKEYVPENQLIEKVSVYSWHTKYSFYERFKSDALKYINVTHPKCGEVKYFSYMPSYVQMSLRQRQWYFYWRSCVRRGEYLPTDSSYILLYLYEIINLPEVINPEMGLQMMCDVWSNYRESYTKLDKSLTEWVCDYCLINGLKPPLKKIEDFYPRIREISSFKQFYFQGASEGLYASLLMARLNDYNFLKSKYITDQNRRIFAEHIVKGFAHGVKVLSLRDGRFDSDEGRLIKRKVVRDVFSGAICCYEAKRRVEAECFDIGNVKGLELIVTDMVRYCENRVRACLGIRARLKVLNLSQEQKEALDSYFDKELPCVYFEKKTKLKNVQPDLDAVTESEAARPFIVSIEKAKEIEEKGWVVTDRLMEYYEEEPAEEKKAVKTDESEALDIAKEALKCIAKGDLCGFMKIAEDSFMMEETLAECVNELCYTVIGDIGIEESENGGYRLIPDYEEEIEEWLNS